MHRFFIEECSEETVRITGEDVNHISRVLRMSLGDPLELVYDERLFLGEIVSMEKKVVVVKVLEERPSLTATTRLYVFQGVGKGEKMDFLIQKLTELGVDTLIPLQSDRVVVQWKDQKEMKKLERWQRISDEAAKQSKRLRRMKIKERMDVNQVRMWMQNHPQIPVFLAYEGEKEQGVKNLLQGLKSVREAAVMIGPEGGFEDWEVACLQKAGARVVTLGDRILRMETAAITMAVLVQYEWGELGR